MPVSGNAQHALRASWWIAAIAFLSGIGGGVVFPILPALGVKLGLSAAMVGLILAANRITRIFVNPFTGSLIDRFGARWPVACGLFCEAVAVLAFSVALHSTRPADWFLAGRVVWGIGSSLILVGALGAVMAISAAGNRGRLTGRVRTAMTLGIPAGMVLGGVIADTVSPNAAFLSAAALTLVTGIFALYAIPKRARSMSTATHKHAATGVWRALMRQPPLQVIWGSNALIMFAVSGVLLATLVVLINARGIHVFGLAGSGTAGLLMAWMMVFRALASLGSGVLVDRASRRTAWLLPAAVLTAAGFVGLGLAQQAWDVALALAAIGFGSGALSVPLLTLLSDTAAPATQGRAMSLYQVYGDVGGSIGPIVGLQLGVLSGYGPIYLAVAVAMVLLAIPLGWLVRHERAQQRQITDLKF